MRKTQYFFWVLLIGGLAAGCGPKQAPQYALQGQVISLDTEKNLITVQHGDIPGFMPAMTMSYEMADVKEAGGISPGDTISAELTVVQGVGRLGKIQLVKKAPADAPKPTPEVHIPAPGDRVPDFHFTNEDGHSLHLTQLGGKTLLVTFIYTRCPLPDYCPRMNENFVRVQSFLREQGKNVPEVELLSISFDPDYDTPAVLQHYAKLYTHGNTQQSRAHWQFVVPDKKDLPEVARFFGLLYGPDGSSIAHSASTTVIGPDGKVVKWYGDNQWSPEDAAKTILGTSAHQP